VCKENDAKNKMATQVYHVVSRTHWVLIGIMICLMSYVGVKKFFMVFAMGIQYSNKMPHPMI
jgi:hypothetical protein